MKAQLTGMGSHQGLPTDQSYLVVSYLDRLEDGDGDASVAQYFAAYHPGSDTWRDAHAPGVPLLLPVTLTRITRVEITEVFRYADRPEVRTVFGGWATATSLDGTQIDYTQLRPAPAPGGLEPLTMQAARELLLLGQAALDQAGSVPYPTFGVFPDPATATHPALALDTGAVYVADGTGWGSPIGYVTTKQAADALAARIAAVEGGQVGGLIGYATQAALNADLAHPEGAVGVVTNDPVAAKNGEYRKTGASGAGAWVAASTSRLALVEAGQTSNTAAVAQITDLVPGLNLYDPGLAVDGQGYDLAGVASAVSGQAISGKIPVTAGQTYTLWTNSGAQMNSRLHYFTGPAGETWLGSSSALSAGVTESRPDAYGVTFTPSLGSNVTRVGQVLYLSPTTHSPAEFQARAASYRLQTGSARTAPDFAPPGRNLKPSKLLGYTENLAITADLLSMTTLAPATANLYDWAAAVDGELRNTAGTISPSVTWARSGLMPVTAGQTYTFWTSQTTPALHTSVALFDASRVYLGRLGVNLGTAPYAVSTEIRFLVPAGVAFVEINLFAGAAHTQPEFEARRTSIMLELSPAKTTFAPYSLLRTLKPDRYKPPATVAAVPFLPRVVASGGSVYVAEPWSASNLAVSKWGRAGSNNVWQPLGLAVIAAGTADTSLAAAYTAGTLHTTNDDPAPLRLNGLTIGANHGHALTRTSTTSAAHGLTVEDVGSIWADPAAVQWTLIKVESATILRFGRTAANGNGDGSWVIPAGGVAIGSLTHVSGALHTSGLTVSADAISSIDLFPGVRFKTQTVWVDGVAVVDGSSYSGVLRISEEYDVLNYTALLIYLQSRAGSAVAVDYAHASIAALATVRLEYRVTGAEATVDAVVTLGASPVRVGSCGIVQAQPPVATGGQKIVQFMPETLSLGGLDYVTGVDITTAPGADVTVYPASYRHAGYPPRRMKQALQNADGSPIIALELGYEEDRGVARPALRNTALGTGHALRLATTRKQYPTLFGEAAAVTATAAGTRWSGRAFRRYTRA